MVTSLALTPSRVFVQGFIQQGQSIPGRNLVLLRTWFVCLCTSAPAKSTWSRNVHQAPALLSCRAGRAEDQHGGTECLLSYGGFWFRPNMGTGASISICQSLSSVKVKHCGNKVGPEPQRIFGSPLDRATQGTAHHSVPLVVQHTVEYLEEFGLNHKGLFRISGSAAKIRALRLKYDQGEEVDLVKEGDIDSVASLLKVFLNQLPTAVFPEEMCTDIGAIFEENRNCTTEQTRCLKRLVSSLPEAHSRLVCFLIRFLAKVGANSGVNQMTLENLAIVFGPTLFRIPCSPSACGKQTLCNAVLLHVLQHHEDLFPESSNNGFSPVEEPSQDLHPASPPQEFSQRTEENEPR